MACRIRNPEPVKYAHLISKCICAKLAEIDEFHKKGKRCILLWDPISVETRGETFRGCEPKVIAISDFNLSGKSEIAKSLILDYDIKTCLVLEIVLPSFKGGYQKFYVRSCRP